MSFTVCMLHNATKPDHTVALLSQAT